MFDRVDLENLRVQQLARTGDAPNQCRACGAFRLDGAPPTAHRTGCIHSAGPLNDPLGRVIRETSDDVPRGTDVRHGRDRGGHR